MPSPIILYIPFHLYFLWSLAVGQPFKRGKERLKDKPEVLGAVAVNAAFFLWLAPLSLMRKMLY